MSTYLMHDDLGSPAWVRFAPDQRWHRIATIAHTSLPFAITTLCHGSGEVSDMAQLSAIVLEDESCPTCRAKELG
jgi:hypothetical protein